MEFLLGYTVGFLFQISALLIGFCLGRMTRSSIDQKSDLGHKINQIFRKVVPHPEVGPIVRPDKEAVRLYNNPKEAAEQGIMTNAFDILNSKKEGDAK